MGASGKKGDLDTVTPRVLYVTHNIATSSNTVLFLPIGGEANVTSTTETNVDIPVSIPLQGVICRASVSVNTKDGNSVLAFRDDGASLGTITVAAAQTGEFSTAFTDTIAIGSRLNFMRDNSASTTGSLANETQAVEVDQTS